MDSFGGPEVHHGEIPSTFKAKFCVDFAKIQVIASRYCTKASRYLTNRQKEMASILFPKLGGLSVFPMAPLMSKRFLESGPFETAGDYFIAWTRSAKFLMSEETFNACLPPHLAEQLTWLILNFPSCLEAVVHKLPTRPGPFPLYHPDLYQSNFVVDKDCNILFVIDWENASTVPWEVVEFPLFLQTVTPPLDAPENYTADGQHIDEDVRELWKEREQYVDSVRQAEEAMHIDNNLSDNLGNRDIQNFATALKLYSFDGKIGYYCKALAPFTANGQPDWTES